MVSSKIDGENPNKNHYRISLGGFLVKLVAPKAMENKEFEKYSSDWRMEFARKWSDGSRLRPTMNECGYDFAQAP